MLLPLRNYLPFSRLPIVTLALIGLNVLLFVVGLGQTPLQGAPASVAKQDVWVYEWGTIPCELLERCANQPGRALATHNDPVVAKVMGGGRTVGITVPARNPWLTLLASAFIHGSWLHLAFNMLFLWVFGGSIEDAMSRWSYLSFYLCGAIVAGLCQSLVSPNSTIPQIGASGAIAGLIGGYLLLYPRTKVLTVLIIPIIVTLPAWVVAGGWGVVQFIATWQSVFVPGAGNNGIAYVAHLAGFLYGMAVVRLVATPNPLYEQLYHAEGMDLS